MPKLFPIVVKKTVVGGGGGDALVAWGPDYGGDAGDRHEVGVSVALASPIELIAEQIAAAAFAMPSLELVGTNAAAGASLAMPDLELVGTNAGCGVSPAIVALEVDGFSLGGGASASMPSLDLTGQNAGCGVVAPTMPSLELSATVPGCGSDVSSLTYQTSAFLASKDVWWPEIALCPDDANKDGTDLTVDGVVATRKDALIGFDLAGFPTGATVTAATLTLNVKTGPGLDSNANLNHIADANEGWNEATVSCADNPASAGADQAVTILQNAAGDVSFALNSTWRTRIQNRMGVGVCSFFYIVAAASTQVIFQATDEGTDDALGPRLALTWTMPT